MQVPASSVRQWFNKERIRQGHQGNYQKSHAPEAIVTTSTSEPNGE